MPGLASLSCTRALAQKYNLVVINNFIFPSFFMNNCIICQAIVIFKLLPLINTRVLLMEGGEIRISKHLRKAQVCNLVFL